MNKKQMIEWCNENLTSDDWGKHHLLPATWVFRTSSLGNEYIVQCDDGDEVNGSGILRCEIPIFDVNEMQHVNVKVKHGKAAQYFLSRCIAVQKERGEQYEKGGAGERSFSATAAAFNAITGRDLKGSDICLILQCLKDVRQYSDPSRFHDDSVLDKVSYSSLWAEELHREIGE